MTSRYIRETFNVSSATAKRDMLDLECAIACDRTGAGNRYDPVKLKGR